MARCRAEAARRARRPDVKRPAAALLRSPPFPWVSTRQATVDAPGSAIGTRGGDGLLELIREARVGGAFWLPSAAVPAGPRALVAARDARQRREIQERLDDEPARSVCEEDGRYDPWSLLDGDVVVHADADHELAALAQIAGKPVRLYGEGRFGSAGRADPAAVRRALLDEGGYRNPFTDAPATIEQAVAILADWRALIEANHRVAALVGIARWKRREVSRLFWAPRVRPFRYARNAGAAIATARRGGGRVVAWPSREPADLRPRAAAAGVAVGTVEDGFIRSVGLGSGLHPPLSVVVDERGIHYDPAGASDLEIMLESLAPTPELIDRARRLRETIVRGGIAKYGGGGSAPLPQRQPGRRLVLVPGQVEDDLSVRRGGQGVNGNLDLIARARASETDAEIWYRPHPDVDAGHRRGAVPDAAALEHADRIIRGHGMSDLLLAVDGVHVLTSLTGFEALVRGVEVTTHGVPFFAGWGLTRDLGPVPARRTRALSLDALVAGVLILYPRYLDPVTALPCPVEILVDRFLTQSMPRGSWLTRLRALQGRVMRRIEAHRLGRG